MLDRSCQRTKDRRRHAARARKRRERQRRRQGLAVLHVVVDEHRLIEALEMAGRLSPDDGLRRERVEQEAGRVLADWAARWTVTRTLDR